MMKVIELKKNQAYGGPAAEPGENKSKGAW